MYRYALVAEDDKKVVHVSEEEFVRALKKAYEQTKDIDKSINIVRELLHKKFRQI